MALEDREKTIFTTAWGTFCYQVMPFGLKNAGATYQRAMVALLHDMMHKELEVYVDDMIAKSRTTGQHVGDIRKLFDRLRKFRLRLNPAKFAFGVSEGKLLGFMVNKQGIEVDPDKIKAIQEMSVPKIESEIRGYLDKPPVLVSATPSRPLILYLTVLEESMGCVLGQQDDTGRKEQAIYYLSKKFIDCEQRYLALERTCCALVWATKRLRQYMLAHTTWLIAKTDPIKYILERPALTGRIACWQMALTEFDIVYTTQKAIKGRVVADHLAYHPLPDYQPLSHEFPDEDIMTISGAKTHQDEWLMWFDGASNVLAMCFPFSARLGFNYTNNMAEYEA
ncbi:Retrovirus-related Pol polyprotein from transposon 17.6, partial [Mucuna pruriens]